MVDGALYAFNGGGGGEVCLADRRSVGSFSRVGWVWYREGRRDVPATTPMLVVRVEGVVGPGLGQAGEAVVVAARSAAGHKCTLDDPVRSSVRL